MPRNYTNTNIIRRIFPHTRKYLRFYVFTIRCIAEGISPVFKQLMNLESAPILA